MSAANVENPFEHFDLDPCASVEEITAHMRELVSETPESQRQLVRDSWEALTQKPQRRIAAALSTFIERDPARAVAPPTLQRDLRSNPSPPSGDSGTPRAAASPIPAVHSALAPAGDLARSPETDPLLESLRS